MAKTVNVTINPKTAEITFDLEGFVGTECTDLTNVLSKGNTVTDQQLKAEYDGSEKLPVYEND